MPTEIEQLAAQIEAHRVAYARGEPQLSDFEYDALEERLRQCDPQHPLLQQPGAKVTAEAKASHAVPMLSLQKTYDRKELSSWVDGRAVVGTVKIDGNSLSLVYHYGKLQVAKTRGDGRRGANVTAKSMHITAVPTAIKDPRHLEVRGELYCENTKFYTVAAEMEALALPRPLSPRNVVAGLLGRKEHPQLVRHLSFSACDLLYHDEGTLPATEMDKLERLAALGFSLPQPQLLTSTAELETYLAQVREKLEDGDVPLDGAVFAFNSLAHARVLGDTAHHPRGRMAFKWQGETAVATIKDILWDTSRFGIVTPVAAIAPVFLNKASIRRVTLHNAATVKLYQLKRGSEIKIVRSGEVIPKFLAVVSEGEGDLAIPTHCPACATVLEDDGVRLLCTSSACPAQRLRAVLNWIRCAEIRDLSVKRLAAMIDLGMVESIPDLYHLSKDDLLRVPLTGERLASKLHASITASKKLPAERLLSGLGIRGGGRATWRALLQVAPTIEDLMQLSVAEISALDGFAEKSAEQIYQGLQAQRPLLKALRAAGVEVITARTPTSNQSDRYVISGALSQPRAYYQDLIEQHGATLASSVSTKTTAVVTANANSTASKVRAAHKLGIPIISEQELLHRLPASSHPK